VYKVLGQILLERVTAAHLTECDGSQSNPNVIQTEGKVQYNSGSISTVYNSLSFNIW